MHIKLAGLDLNLLLLFDAVAEHRQVTAAAATVGLSQSAASHALRRLRETLGDPLFVRGQDGLVPTARAELLARGVRSALTTLRHAVEERQPFRAVASTRSFRIAAGDGFDVVVLPSLVRDVSKLAPNVELSVVRPAPTQSMLGAQLEGGEVDLYFGVLPTLALFSGLLSDPGARGLRTATVYEEGWICLVRRGHPRIKRSVTKTMLARERHVLFSPTGGGLGVVDRLLEADGLSRRVAFRVSSFEAALECVRATDCIWTGPKRIAETLDPRRELLHLKPPLALPDYPTRIVWHERFAHDDAHRWIRERVIASVRKRGSRRTTISTNA